MLLATPKASSRCSQRGLLFPRASCIVALLSLGLEMARCFVCKIRLFKVSFSEKFCGLCKLQHQLKEKQFGKKKIIPTKSNIPIDPFAPISAHIDVGKLIAETPNWSTGLSVFKEEYTLDYLKKALDAAGGYFKPSATIWPTHGKIESGQFEIGKIKVEPYTIPKLSAFDIPDYQTPTPYKANTLSPKGREYISPFTSCAVDGCKIWSIIYLYIYARGLTNKIGVHLCDEHYDEHLDHKAEQEKDRSPVRFVEL